MTFLECVQFDDRKFQSNSRERWILIGTDDGEKRLTYFYEVEFSPSTVLIYNRLKISVGGTYLKTDHNI